MNRFLVDRYKALNLANSTNETKQKNQDANYLNGSNDSTGILNTENNLPMDSTNNIPNELENAKSNKKKKIPSGPIIKKTRWEPRISSPDDIAFSSLAGIEKIIDEIRKNIERPLKQPEIYLHLGIEPPKGILIFGPTGSGKTSLAHAIAGEFGLAFIDVPSTEIISGLSGESESNIRAIFESAKKHSPSIIFFDEIDLICGRRDVSLRDMDRRMASQLMTCLDSIIPGEIIVLGATSRPEHIEPALRRAGRFDKEIHIGLPDEHAKKKLLSLMTKKIPLSDDVNLDHLARNIPGFAPADIKALLREAGHMAIDHYQNGQNGSKLEISALDIRKALGVVQPAAKREGFATAPDISWDSIGALERVRAELRMAVVEPLRNPELFAKVGITTPSGILLWGPPGCGKTLLAKAVANETLSNFISVKGPELLNKYVGESERAVRTVFERARISAPCIIFFDELESLCSHRSDPGENHAARVVNQFLTELDGLEGRRDVYIIGATNRPDMIDPAMLRPGRLDKHVYVQLPTEIERLEILIKLTTRTPLGGDVDLKEISTSHRTDGYTGADLSNLVRIASELAIQPYLESPTTKENMETICVCKLNFEIALTKVKPSVSISEQMEYDRLANNFRTHVKAHSKFA